MTGYTVDVPVVPIVILNKDIVADVVVADTCLHVIGVGSFIELAFPTFEVPSALSVREDACGALDEEMGTAGC